MKKQTRNKDGRDGRKERGGDRQRDLILDL
jgi:hypothetical protein